MLVGGLIMRVLLQELGCVVLGLLPLGLFLFEFLLTRLFDLEEVEDRVHAEVGVELDLHLKLGPGDSFFDDRPVLGRFVHELDCGQLLHLNYFQLEGVQELVHYNFEVCL